MIEDYFLEIPIPDNHLSYSRIKTYDVCGHKFYLQYVKKVRGLVRVPQLLGTSFHIGQDHGIKSMIEKKVLKPKEVIEIAVENLKTDFKKNKKAIDYTEFDDNKARAQDDLKSMVSGAYNKIVTSFRPTSSEESFEIKIDGIAFHGRIDVVESLDRESDCITELKTTTRLPSTMFDFQTSVYSMAKQGIKYIKKFFVLRRKNKNRDMEIRIYKKEIGAKKENYDIGKFRNKIEYDMIHGFTKTINLENCSWCSYRFGCRPEIFSDKNKTNIEMESIEIPKGDQYNENRIRRIVRSFKRQGVGRVTGTLENNRKKSPVLPDRF